MFVTHCQIDLPYSYIGYFVGQLNLPVMSLIDIYSLIDRLIHLFIDSASRFGHWTRWVIVGNSFVRP